MDRLRVQVLVPSGTSSTCWRVTVRIAWTAGILDVHFTGQASSAARCSGVPHAACARNAATAVRGARAVPNALVARQVIRPEAAAVAEPGVTEARVRACSRERPTDAAVTVRDILTARHAARQPVQRRFGTSRKPRPWCVIPRGQAGCRQA